jgi:hypothetical protein
LEGVADEGGGPAEEDAAEAFGFVDAAPGGEVGGVDFGVDLAAAFDLCITCEPRTLSYVVSGQS